MSDFDEVVVSTANQYFEGDTEQFKDGQGNFNKEKFVEIVAAEQKESVIVVKGIQESEIFFETTNDSFETPHDRLIKSTFEIIESEQFQRVQNGEKNDALVASLQQNLVNLGYDLGSTGFLKNGVDGDYIENGLTDQGIEKFKTDNKRERNNLEMLSPIEKNGLFR